MLSRDKTEPRAGRGNRPEILAPVGSPEALTAAVRAGADAVYLGAGRFNARQNAKNFDDAALRDAASLCHARGVKLYLTLNTLVREDELSAALKTAALACEAGADALILQDLGLTARIRAAAPAMPLHASTQLSCHTPAGVRELAALGFSRVVLAREMSREEIAACAGQGAELEVFVHGALCMSVSGQCLLSAVLGGRSGNRGLCAGPCRLPFCPARGTARPGPGDTALSLKDLSLLDAVGELAALGVDSLKIEGRMKRPEYVAAASAAFAAARDHAADPACPPPGGELLADLRSVFSRSGFTDGYYRGRRDDSLFGARTREDVTAAAPALKRLARLYDKETPRVPVSLALRAEKGLPCVLTASDAEGRTASVTGPVPEQALSRPLDAERAAAQLAKTGGTPFAARVECHIGGGVTLPLSALNALRREALDELLAIRAAPCPKAFDAGQPAALSSVGPGASAAAEGLRRNGEGAPFRLAVRAASAEQLPGDLLADAVVLPLSTPAGVLEEWADRSYITVLVEIPRGLFGREKQTVRLLKRAEEAGVRLALCQNIGAFPLAREAGMLPVAGAGMNLFNRTAGEGLAARGAGALVLSPELTPAQARFARELPVPTGFFAYGRQPLMLLRACPLRAKIGCAACGRHGALVDRLGVRFPLACAGGCAELLNSTPLWLADRLDKLPPADFLLLWMTDESPARVGEVVRAYREGGAPPASFTRGLAARGVQ